MQYRYARLRAHGQTDRQTDRRIVHRATPRPRPRLVSQSGRHPDAIVDVRPPAALLRNSFSGRSPRALLSVCSACADRVVSWCNETVCTHKAPLCRVQPAAATTTSDSRPRSLQVWSTETTDGRDVVQRSTTFTLETAKMRLGVHSAPAIV